MSSGGQHYLSELGLSAAVGISAVRKFQNKTHLGKLTGARAKYESSDVEQNQRREGQLKNILTEVSRLIVRSKVIAIIYPHLGKYCAAPRHTINITLANTARHKTEAKHSREQLRK